MPDLLEDVLNLHILEKIVSGKVVSVNLSFLSAYLKKHRKTIANRVSSLFSHNIIDRPVYPFMGLYKEYPLLIAVRADLPDDKAVEDWVRNDKHIFAAFRVRKGEYNTLLFMFHRDVLSYQLWRESLVEEQKIPPRDLRHPSSPSYYSNQLVMKYDPNAPIKLMEEEFLSNGKLEVNGYVLDDVAFQSLKCLVNGVGIKVNENELCNRLGVHRKTVIGRISKLMETGLVAQPVCRFPNFFSPPQFLAAFSLYEVRKKTELLEEIKKDPHITVALSISSGIYNLLTFGVYRTIKDHIEWERHYARQFPACIDSGDVTYLSPEMTIPINQQKVSLGIIESKFEQLQEKKDLNKKKASSKPTYLEVAQRPQVSFKQS